MQVWKRRLPNLPLPERSLCRGFSHLPFTNMQIGPMAAHESGVRLSTIQQRKSGRVTPNFPQHGDRNLKRCR
jgi:hypothetical protein